MESKEYEFIGKTLFFPAEEILVVGDLHIGYDHMIEQSGVLIPERQVKDIISELKEIFKRIEESGRKISKIIFLGDIKHSFGYEWKEENYFQEAMEFLRTKFKDENIILLKGNHDTIDYSFEKKMKKYHIHKGTAFIHGHEAFKSVFDNSISTLIMGHIHPSVILSDKQNIKREKYKCFLTGEFKGKNLIVLPSFLATVEGATVNEYEHAYKDFFSIIPKKDLMKFQVHVVGEDKVYSFGKISEL
jgi:hypothetical protein